MTPLIEQTRSSTSVFDGVLLKVYRDEVRCGDGSGAVREWIDHPGAAAVVPILADGTTRLVRQYRYPARRAFLEVPAGKLDVPGESVETLARREMEEETGCRGGRLVSLGAFYPCIGYSNERIHVYLALGVIAGERKAVAGEVLHVEVMPFEEAVALARTGGLADMKTALALMLAADRLARDVGEDTGDVL